MWYDIENSENGIVISSRVRLARNLKNYPFSIKISDQQSSEMIDNIKQSFLNLNGEYRYLDLKEFGKLEKVAMVEKHTISADLLKKEQPTSVILTSDETVSVMLNEEDHIRIQAILAGENLDLVWNRANEIDDMIENNIEYAYDSDYGYLTSCPTNVGTGMRASYMVHIPLIELTSQIKHISQFISKFGLTVRGIYGEGSEPQGGIYQISNQITLGKTEEDILSNLKAVTGQVIEQEQKLRQRLLRENYVTLEDQVYRAYGLVTNAKIMSLNEAMKDLSYVRLGYETGVLKQNLPLSNIYSIMINIQPANLLKHSGRDLNEVEMNIARAEFIKKQFNAL